MSKSSKKIKNAAFISIGLIVINVMVFLIMSYYGDTEDTQFLHKMGAMYVPDVIYNGEYYRVITHMFLHSGYQHIFYNMIMLIAVGLTLEEKIGHIKYTIIYFLGGIGATALSGWYEYYTNSFSIGVGASGAIMAVFGALLAVTYKDSRRKSAELRRLLIVLAIMILGNTGPGIDWMAHLGGAVSGLILGFLLYRGK